VSRPSLALAGAYVALGALVVAGALNGLDQWAVDHVMWGLGGASPGPSTTQAVVPLLHADWHGPLDVVANVVTLPAQGVIGSVLAAGCCLALMRRGRRRLALACGIGWLAANAMEVICKLALSRPLLHEDGYALYQFESSWPSGHTLRSVLLAALLALVWPAASRWVAAWAAASLLLLEVDGVHVPTDIAGGVLLAALTVVAVRREADRPS
jgi:membrane-associated phospholipid phosphatase